MIVRHVFCLLPPETQRAWHPGVSWWPLSVLERDSHWSKAVKAVPILPDYYYAEVVVVVKSVTGFAF